MKIERKGNELLIRLKVGKKDTKIQNILDLLNYMELTSKTKSTEQNSDTLFKEMKKGRWKRNKDNIKNND